MLTLQQREKNHQTTSRGITEFLQASAVITECLNVIRGTAIVDQ
jgi:hypothetical protein